MDCKLQQGQVLVECLYILLLVASAMAMVVTMDEVYQTRSRPYETHREIWRNHAP